MESPTSYQDLYLFRVHKNEILDRSKYEFFTGLDGGGGPTWSADMAASQSVFHDPNGVEWGVNCMYHPVLKRYWLTVRHEGDTGKWGLFDAPEPWGPWTTVAYDTDFPTWTYTPVGGRPAWCHVFPTKWISADGLTVWQANDRGDRFNLVKVTLTLRTGTTAPTRDDIDAKIRERKAGAASDTEVAAAIKSYREQ
jgi:hypothetical protein